jgi:hypothetical protein
VMWIIAYACGDLSNDCSVSLDTSEL